MNSSDYEEILETNIGFCDDPTWTFKDYLKNLLLTLWKEQEGFSGKRPFGDSGWKYDLYKPLIKLGYIDGSFDEWGDLEHVDEKSGWKLVKTLIEYVFNNE